MPALKRILLATEFSATCACARSHAQALARRHGAELHVVHVQVLHGDQFGWDGIPHAGDVQQAVGDLANSRMAGFTAELDGSVVTKVERDISAAPAINHYAAEHDVDLIVTGTHARRGLSRLFLGSVATEVLRHADQPVLVVGPDQTLAPQGYQHLLVPVDFSDAATRASRQALEIGKSRGARLSLHHVIDDRPLPPYFPEHFADQAREHAQHHLEQFVTAMGASLPVDSAVSVGIPADELAEHARSSAVDLIVMGSTGLTALDQLLLGSTADRLLRLAPCPVLVHRGDVISPL